MDYQAPAAWGRHSASGMYVWRKTQCNYIIGSSVITMTAESRHVVVRIALSTLWHFEQIRLATAQCSRLTSFRLSFSPHVFQTPDVNHSKGIKNSGPYLILFLFLLQICSKNQHFISKAIKIKRSAEDEEKESVDIRELKSGLPRP